MKSRRLALPFTVLGLSWLGLAGLVLGTAGQFPAKVATHFNAAGMPNGWMTRSQHITGMLVVGVGLSLFIVGVFLLMRLANGDLINLPNRDYWLAPERKAETLDDLLRRGVWLACMMVAFDAALHFLILRANNQVPVLLSNTQMGWLSGALLTGIVIWLIGFLLHFFRKP